MDDQVQRLRDALGEIRSSDGAYATELRPSGGKIRKIAWYSRQLGSSGLLESNGQGHLRVSDDAVRWLSTGDNQILAGILHSRILLFGEILQLIVDAPGATHSQLWENATKKYHLDWKTIDPIRKRVGWLRSLGYVELSFDRKLTVTPSGLEVLGHLDVFEPADRPQLAESLDVPDPILPETVVVEMEELTLEKLAQRKSAFGYVPRSNSKDMYESLRQLCLIFDPDSTKDQFIESCKSHFGVKGTSAMSALYTLKSVGLIEQFSMDGYRLTSRARDWIDSCQYWGLVAIIHTHILLVGELIPHLTEVRRVPHLRDVVNAAYGTQLSLSEIRSRIHLLVACSIVEQLAPGQYRATAEGLALVDKLTLLPEKSTEVDFSQIAQDIPSDTSGVLRSELTAAAVDSQHSERFELAVQKAFEAMGFQAEHLGGPGKTDVLVHFASGPGQVRRFIADAKTSASGVVTDAMVQFPALKDHTVKHEAEFAVLIAPEFSGRIVSWATENNVVLLSVSRLMEILDNQQRNPAPLDMVVGFLGGNENGWSRLESEWRSQQRTGDLLIAVIDCLRREYEYPDEETGGALSVEQLYFVLRSAVTPRPSQASLRPLLEFLSSPLVQGVRPSGRGWKLPDPPALIAERLRAIATHIDRMNEAD